MIQKNSSESSLKFYQNNDSADLYLNSFSHIYVEKEILNDEAAKSILKKFKNSRVIIIDNYKNVFNRQRQNFEIQKNSRKLILAKKHGDFFYKGSELCEDFGEKMFYYSSSIYNCMFNCEYCYLKGLYQTADVVIFVNIEDYFDAVKKEIQDKNAYFCISYDSDLLSFEKITGFCSKWIEFGKENPNIKIEIRTKSTGFRFIENEEIPSNIIFAWTLLPQKIADEYEKLTPSIDERIEDINRAINKGLKIRISIEPVIKISDFENVYGEFVDYLFSRVNRDGIRDINVGAFRMCTEQIKRIRSLNESSKIFSYNLPGKDGYVTYDDTEYMVDFIKKRISKYFSESNIY